VAAARHLGRGALPTPVELVSDVVPCSLYAVVTVTPSLWPSMVVSPSVNKPPASPPCVCRVPFLPIFVSEFDLVSLMLPCMLHILHSGALCVWKRSPPPPFFIETKHPAFLLLFAVLLMDPIVTGLSSLGDVSVNSDLLLLIRETRMPDFF